MKNEGYTFIEVIVGISILSILLWGIVPQLSRLEGLGQDVFIQTKDDTTMTHMVKTLTSDISGIHWTYWQPAPKMELTSQGIQITGKTEIGEAMQYSILKDENTIILNSNGITTGRFSFSSLTDFKINIPDSSMTDFTLVIETPTQSLSIPLNFGSKAVSIHEEI